MKLKSILIALFSFVIIVAATVGCKKEKINKETENTDTVSIQDLKAYMSMLTNVPVAKISYDEKTAQFIALGVNQISRADLTSSYFNAKKRP